MLSLHLKVEIKRCGIISVRPRGLFIGLGRNPIFAVTLSSLAWVDRMRGVFHESRVSFLFKRNRSPLGEGIVLFGLLKSLGKFERAKIVGSATLTYGGSACCFDKFQLRPSHVLRGMFSRSRSIGFRAHPTRNRRGSNSGAAPSFFTSTPFVTRHNEFVLTFSPRRAPSF